MAENPSELAPPSPTARSQRSSAMALPAVVYLAVLRGGEATGGWTIPMATEIALVVGMLGGSALAYHDGYPPLQLDLVRPTRRRPR